MDVQSQSQMSGVFIRTLLLALFNKGAIDGRMLATAGEHVDGLVKRGVELEQGQRLACQVFSVVTAPSDVVSPKARQEVDRSDKSPRARRMRQLGYEGGELTPPKIPGDKLDRAAKHRADLISMPLDQLIRKNSERKEAGFDGAKAVRS